MIVSWTWILDTARHEYRSNVSAAVYLAVEPERLLHGGLGRWQIVSLRTRRFQKLFIEEILRNFRAKADIRSFRLILLVDCVR